MTLEITQAYIATVGPDHTIVLPDDIAVGATVAVVLLSSTPKDDKRRARFAATLSAIRAAIAAETSLPIITDEDLTALIEKARQHPQP